MAGSAQCILEENRLPAIKIWNWKYSFDDCKTILGIHGGFNLSSAVTFFPLVFTSEGRRTIVKNISHSDRDWASNNTSWVPFFPSPREGKRKSIRCHFPTASIFIFGAPTLGFHFFSVQFFFLFRWWLHICAPAMHSFFTRSNCPAISFFCYSHWPWWFSAVAPIGPYLFPSN